MKTIILGVSGASGVILAKALARGLKQNGVRIHMVITHSARLTWNLECEEPIEVLTDLADVLWDEQNMAASIASGSFETDGMVVCPCSMKTLAGIVTGYTDNLLLRAADVCLKENRTLILVPREMPLGKVHLRNMKDAADLGCILIPPMLTFYSGQKTMEDQIDAVVGKILGQLHLPYEKYKPWACPGAF